MTLSRREMLKLGVAGTAAVALPLEQLAFTSPRLKDRLPASKLPDPFTVPFARPPVAKRVFSTSDTDFYKMRMQNKKIEILPGYKTEVWGYNGVTPGPTIYQDRGRTAVVRHINVIRNPDHTHTSVHLHGNASLPQYDGYASDVTLPGQYKDYRYPNDQHARTLWYHDHGVHFTSLNAYMGCAAFYITRDQQEQSLPIPHGRYDVPLILRDALFAKDGSLIFDDDGESGLYGDVILVNGRPWPRMKVERRKYRFRVLNGGVSRSYNLALSSGEPLTVIGHDGGLAPFPAETRSMRVGMAERYEVVIDFAKYKVGDKVVLQNRELKNNREFDNTDVVMRFDVVSGPTSHANNSVPDALDPDNEVMALQETPGLTKRYLRFERENGHWTINGLTWQDVIDSNFQANVGNPGLGDTEVWTLENKSGGWFHPVHIHLIDFKVLDRNGRPPHAYERGPKDVVYVGEGEKVRVIMKFGPQIGRYMVHCHNLVHEDHDMMHQFEVGTGGPDPITSDPAKDRSLMPPLT
jgi:spore coat protein A, manganese oxidase